MENRIEFYPEWREGDSHGVVAWASWNLNGDPIVEYDKITGLSLYDYD